MPTREELDARRARLTPQQRAILEERLRGDFRPNPATGKAAGLWSSLVAIQPEGSKTPLFCIHPSNGSVNCYADLARHLGKAQPLYGLQAQGMDKLQPLLTIAEEMAAHYLQELRQLQPQGPYLLLGWSTGGIIAFEMARQLLAQQQAVAYLGILDASAIPDALTQAADDTTFLSLFLRNIFGTSTLDFASLEKHYRSLAPAEQLSYVLAEVKQAKLLAPGVSQEEFTHLFKIFRSNVAAVLNYHPQPYPGEVHLYRAVEQQRDPAIPPDLGWQRLVTGKLEVILAAGNHHTMLKEPHVESLAERIKASIGLLDLTP